MPKGIYAHKKMSEKERLKRHRAANLKSATERYYKLRNRGICVRCGKKKAEPGKKACLVCAKKFRGHGLRHYYKNHEKSKKDALYYKRTENYGCGANEYFEAQKKKQKNRCAVCGGPPDGRWKTLNQDHKGDQKRGLLCTKCNRGLGLFKDSPKIVKNAFNYLNRWKKKADADNRKKEF